MNYQTEIGKIIPFIISLKRIKYLGINLTKEVKDLFSENYKTLVKAMIIEYDTDKWKDIFGLWIRRINIVKMSMAPRPIYKFSAISIKIPMGHFSQKKSIKIFME